MKPFVMFNKESYYRYNIQSRSLECLKRDRDDWWDEFLNYYLGGCSLDATEENFQEYIKQEKERALNTIKFEKEDACKKIDQKYSRFVEDINNV